MYRVFILAFAIALLAMPASSQSFQSVGATSQIQPVGSPIIILPGGSVDAIVVAPGVYAETNKTIGDQAYAACVNGGQVAVMCLPEGPKAIQADVNARWVTAFASE